jgi:hypothetical protein
VKTMIVMGSGLINIYIIHPFVCVSVSLWIV